VPLEASARINPIVQAAHTISVKPKSRPFLGYLVEKAYFALSGDFGWILAKESGA
jgi:hypothetical protein